MWNFVKGFVTAVSLFMLFGAGAYWQEQEELKRTRESRRSQNYSNYRSNFRR